METTKRHSWIICVALFLFISLFVMGASASAATKYKITLNKQGGSGGTASVKVAKGSAMPAISVPSKTGYTFGGYFTKTGGGGTKYYTAAGKSAKKSTFTKATTLYAKWTANKYTVYLNQSGANTAGTTAVTATYASAMPGITIPKKTGYNFGGFFTGTNGTGTIYYNANGTSARAYNYTKAITLYPKWTAAQYTVTFNTQGGTYAGTTSLKVTYDAKPASITVPRKAGAVFTGYTDAWYGGTQYFTASGVATRTWNKAANTTLYAQWSKKTYLVNMDRQGGTGGTTQSFSLSYGDTLPAISIPQKTNYVFSGYYTGKNGTGTMYYNASGAAVRVYSEEKNSTLYAYWKSSGCNNKHDYQATVVTATSARNGSITKVCKKCRHKTVSYASRIRSVAMSANYLTYTGKALCPGINATDAAGKKIARSNYSVSYANNVNMGLARATVTFKSPYAGTYNLSFHIGPKGTKITKVKGGKKSFTVYWKKQKNNTNGYEIQYSRKKSFKGAKKLILGDSRNYSGFKITKLAKKKRYYIRVRTYKEYGDTMFVSCWSRARSVKTK